MDIIHFSAIFRQNIYFFANKFGRSLANKPYTENWVINDLINVRNTKPFVSQAKLILYSLVLPVVLFYIRGEVWN